MIAPGLHIYLGTTGAGKTFKAFEDLQEYHTRTGLGAIVIDSKGARNFAGFPHVRSVHEAVAGTWERRELIFWTPRDEFELEQFFRCIDEAGGIAMIIDEIGFWPNFKPLLQQVRIWRHRHMTYLLTAQHVGKDIGQVLLGCNPTIYVFRTTAPRSLEWLEDWHDLDERVVRAQTTGVYIERQF